ncbi:transposase [Flavobacterium sp. TMP13]|uniref:transposase n=1 Tax=unclassified Flavobacterium TaxID=196869 RepID=UPI0009EBFD8B
MYNSRLFLKIYLYGYVNGLRISRKLLKEYFTNIGMHWLLECSGPNNYTISDFRKTTLSSSRT